MLKKTQGSIVFNRVFAMPNPETFSIKPIHDLVQRYLQDCNSHDGESIDPFARNKNWCSWNNDLDPNTEADNHSDAEEFCRDIFRTDGQCIALALFDPPYSPRQIAECYKGFGREVTTKDTQNAALYKRVRDALDPLILPGGVCLSFGWSTNGMGKGRGYVIEEILLVAHGGAHNDTICMAERKL